MIHLRKKIETSLAMFAKKVIQFGRILAVCSSIVAIGGCGQTGPLYLPTEPAETTPKNVPENETENGTENAAENEAKNAAENASALSSAGSGEVAPA